jgi:hypothetical protein
LLSPEAEEHAPTTIKEEITTIKKEEQPAFVFGTAARDDIHSEREERGHPTQTSAVGQGAVHQFRSLDDFLSIVPGYRELPKKVCADMINHFMQYETTGSEGYLYVFWRKPEVEPPGSSAAPNNTPGTLCTNERLVIKIGSSTRPDRRLRDQVSRCKLQMEVIEQYPRKPGRLVPFYEMVEKMIHTELQLCRQAPIGCACGVDKHREYFEISAEREEILRVQEVVERWVEWGHRHRKRLGKIKAEAVGGAAPELTRSPEV